MGRKPRAALADSLCPGLPSCGLSALGKRRESAVQKRRAEHLPMNLPRVAADVRMRKLRTYMSLRLLTSAATVQGSKRGTFGEFSPRPSPERRGRNLLRSLRSFAAKDFVWFVCFVVETRRAGDQGSGIRMNPCLSVVHYFSGTPRRARCGTSASTGWRRCGRRWSSSSGCSGRRARDAASAR